jgi:hypothetical protein
VDVETRRARVQRRNTEKPASYSFEVNDATFDFMETWFERPSAEELVGAEVIRG